MMGLFFFVAGIVAIWHGFDVGGVGGWGYMIGGVVGWLFALASWGMDTEPRHTTRPPSHPPGWKRK